MANKYSEELFGAIDEILRKRLEDLNKDTTILCSIEDASNAENGEYVVLNNALRFTAYSQITTYTVGQNVWVLVPDGDYNNTKIIVGRYISSDSQSFTWVDPMATFVDMSGNICSDITGLTELGLTANEIDSDTNSLAQKKPFMSVSDLKSSNIINTDLDVVAFQGLDRIGITAQFHTDFPESGGPIAGDYGLIFNIITDKIIKSESGQESNNRITYRWSSSQMTGNPYQFNGYFTQKIVLEHDSDTAGNIIAITCDFYQTPGTFITIDNTLYPAVEGFNNLFVRNLTVMLGYSTDKISGTSARLWTSDSLKYSTTAGGTDRIIHPRLAYRNGDGTYTMVNDWKSFQSFKGEEETQYPKILFYQQDLSTQYVDPRAGDFWHELTLTEEEKEELENNFQLTRTLSAESEERYKVIFIFKNASAYTTKNMVDSIEMKMNTIFLQKYTTAKEAYDRTKIPTAPEYPAYEQFTYSEDERIAIQLFMDLDADFTSDDIYSETTGYFGVLKREKDLDTQYASYYDDSWDSVLPSRTTILWAYISLLTEKAHDNVLRLDGTQVTFLQYLKLVDFYKRFSWSSDADELFEKAKWSLENLYTSNILTFTNLDGTKGQIADLIQGLQLVATDDKHGVYNLYKATTNANSELINASDAIVKRSIEMSFTSFSTEDASLDEAERIYWLLPKSNTMIKDPVEGVSFGAETDNLVVYTEQEFWAWYQQKFMSSGDSTVMDLYYYSSDGGLSGLQLVTESTSYSDTKGGRFYFKTKELLLLSRPGTTDKPGDIDLIGNQNVVYFYAGTSGNDRSEYIQKIKSEEEINFLANNLSNYWIIIEDRVDENSTKKLKKASLTYQIKQTYRRSLTNNKIYAAISRAQQLFTAQIELRFGVKGVNGSEYTLTILPISEQYKDTAETGNSSKINNSPNAWTYNGINNAIGNTENFVLEASVYDNDDNVLTNFTYDWEFLTNQTGSYFVGSRNENKFTITRFGDINFSSDQYFGAIVKCTAKSNTNEDIKVVQYFILPIRTNRSFSYLEGPDTIVYDISGGNPEYYKVAYSLKNESGTDITLNSATPVEICWVGKNNEDPNNPSKQAQYQPTLKDKKLLVPRASYVDQVGYYYYIKINENGGGYWFQPLLTIINNYANTSLTSIKENLDIKDNNDTSKSVATILSVGKADDDGKLTGIVIGSLPKENAENPRSGIIGYINDIESYGFFDSGKCFLGTNGARISVDDSGYKLNLGSKTLMRVSAVDNYLQSANVVLDSHGKATTGIRINLSDGSISGNFQLSTENIPDLQNDKITWGTQERNTVFAAPSSNNGAPSFRELTSNDIPNLGTSKLTSGILGVVRGGTGVDSFTVNSVIMSNKNTADGPLQTRSLTDSTTDGAVSNNDNIVTARTVYHGLIKVNNATQSRANNIYAPISAGTEGQILISSGGTNAPTWKNLTGWNSLRADLGLGASGALAVNYGGTGTNNFTTGQVLVGDGTNPITTKAIDATSGGTRISADLITSGAVYSGLSAKADISHTHTADDINDFEDSVKDVIENNYTALDGSNVILNQVTIGATTYNVTTTQDFAGHTILALQEVI